MYECNRIYTGFSFANISGFSFDVTDDGDLPGAYEITADANGIYYDIGAGPVLSDAAARYYHGALDDTGATDNPGDHIGFAQKFAIALNDGATAAGSTADWSVSWSNATLAYTIAKSTGTGFDLTLSAAAVNLLGLSSAYVNQTSVASVRTPYYVFEPANDGFRMDAHFSEFAEIGSTVYTQSGLPKTISATTSLLRGRWFHDFEPESAVFNYAETDTRIWTWQRMLSFVRGHEPLLYLQTETASPTYSSANVAMRVKLVDEGFRLKPIPARENVSTHWSIPLEGVLLEGFV